VYGTDEVNMQGQTKFSTPDNWRIDISFDVFGDVLVHICNPAAQGMCVIIPASDWDCMMKELGYQPVTDERAIVPSEPWET
jgi:hypothetical protein